MRELVGCNILYYGYDTDVYGRIIKPEDDFDLFTGYYYRDDYHGTAVEAYCLDVDKNQKYKITFQDFPSTLRNTTSGRMKCLYKSERISEFPAEFSMPPYPGEPNPRLTVTSRRSDPDNIEITLDDELVCKISFEDSEHIYGKTTFKYDLIKCCLQPCGIRYDGVTREKIPFMPEELFFTRPEDTLYNFEHRDEIIKELADQGIDYHDHPELVAPDDIYESQKMMLESREQGKFIKSLNDSFLESFEALFPDTIYMEKDLEIDMGELQEELRQTLLREEREKQQKKPGLLDRFLNWLNSEPCVDSSASDYDNLDCGDFDCGDFDYDSSDYDDYTPSIDNNLFDHMFDKYQEAQEDLLSDGIYGNGR